jgi:integrase
MGKRENFTVERVAGFRFKPSDSGKSNQTVYWDGKTPGLGLRVTSGGAKSYIFETRLHGRTLRLTIGDTRTWTVGKAQAEATELKTLTDQGVDPRQEKADRAAAADEKRTEATRQLVTLFDVWTRYVAARRHKWSERHAHDHVSAANRGGGKKKRGTGKIQAGPLADLLDTKLADLTPQRIAKWLDRETKTRPTSTALSFRLLRGCLNWCESEKDLAGLVPSGLLAAPKVRDALPTTVVKQDCLQREQLPLWFENVQKLSNPVLSTYLQALLITGARREELAGIRWEDVDFKWLSIRIRDKVDGERVIPLTPYVAHLLADLKRRNDTPPPRHRILHGKRIENDLENWKPSPWVFSSKTAASGRLAEPRLGHNRALAAAGLPDLTLHGLRRSFGTLSEWCEVPVGVVAQIMGHKPSAIAEKHYRRRPLDLLRSWHVKIEAWILAQAGVGFVPKQSELKSASAA